MIEIFFFVADFKNLSIVAFRQRNNVVNHLNKIRYIYNNIMNNIYSQLNLNDNLLK